MCKGAKTAAKAESEGKRYANSRAPCADTNEAEFVSKGAVCAAQDTAQHLYVSAYRSGSCKRRER